MGDEHGISWPDGGMRASDSKGTFAPRIKHKQLFSPSDEINQLRTHNAELEAKLAATEKERDQAIELMSMRYENLNKDGKTILDFQSVWISQARSRIEKLEAKIAALEQAAQRLVDHAKNSKQELWASLPDVINLRDVLEGKGNEDK